MPKSYFTILMDHVDPETQRVIWTSRSWTKKIYDTKDQAIDALIEMRNKYKWGGLRYKIVELRIVNEITNV